MENKTDEFKITLNKINILFDRKKTLKNNCKLTSQKILFDKFLYYIFLTKKYFLDFQKISVLKKYVLIKDDDLLIFEKDEDSNLNQIKNIQTNEIIKIIPLQNNTIYLIEPKEIKKLDLNQENFISKKIIFKDSEYNKIEPSIFYLDLIKINTSKNKQIIEETVWCLFTNDAKQLYLGFKKDNKDDKNSEILEFSCIFLKNFDDFENVKNIHFKIHKDKDKKVLFLSIFILCVKIGYLYNTNITDCGDINELNDRVIKSFELGNGKNYSIIYKFDELSIDFFYFLEYDSLNSRPLWLLVGNENFIFHLIYLEQEYSDNYNIFENNEIKIKEIQESDDMSYQSIEENVENKFNMKENIKEKENILIYLNELIMGYHNRHKNELGGTNISLNKKLKPEDFKNAFIKLGKIYFFFKHMIYCYDIENNNILTAKFFAMNESITDAFFTEERDGDKNYHNSYVLFNRYLSLFKFEIEDNNEEQESEIDPNMDNANRIRSFLREQKLCEWCYKPAKKRCTGCKQCHYCTAEHQVLDWERHKEYCFFDEKNIFNFSILTHDLENDISKNRIEILQNYKNNSAQNLKKGLDLNYQLIDSTNKILKDHYNLVKKFTSGNLKNKTEILNFIEINKFIFEHISNILLLVNGFIKPFRIMNILKRDFDDDINYKNFFSLIPKIYKYILIQEGTIEFDYQGEEKIKIYNFDKSEIYFKQEIFGIMQDYLDIQSTIAKLYFHIGEFSFYEMYCINHISIIEDIFRNSKKHQYILANCYFNFANLYIEFDELGKAIELYQICTDIIPSSERDKHINIIIYSYFNLGLIYYATDQYNLSKKMIEFSLENNKKKLRNNDDEISAIIHETLGEIELEYKKYRESLDHLLTALNIRKKYPNLSNSESIKKIEFFINFINSQWINIENNISYTEKNNTEKNNNNFKNISNLEILGNGNNSNFTYTNLKNTNNNLYKNNSTSNYNSDEDNLKVTQQLNNFYNNIKFSSLPERPESDMLNPLFPQTFRDDEIDEIEKFFIFITKLNSKELDFLNEEQDNIEGSIPINLSEKFKMSLSYSLKIQLLDIKILKLRRNIVLKNPKEKIAIENLNFEILQKNNSSKKKISNLLNKFSNKTVLEKFSENNFNFLNKKENKNLENNFFNLTNSLNGENKNEKFNDENLVKFNLTKREILLFENLKFSIVNFLKENTNKEGNKVPDDETLVEYIKNFDEEQLKFFIKNPGVLLDPKNEDVYLSNKNKEK